VKLGENANDTCAVLSVTYGGEAMKKSSIDGSKRVERIWKMKKEVVIIFFGIKGIVHFEFISEGQTVNCAYYVEILKWLYEAVYM
jgi:hypothetical protein